MRIVALLCWKGCAVLLRWILHPIIAVRRSWGCWLSTFQPYGGRYRIIFSLWFCMAFIWITWGRSFFFSHSLYLRTWSYKIRIPEEREFSWLWLIFTTALSLYLSRWQWHLKIVPQHGYWHLASFCACTAAYLWKFIIMKLQKCFFVNLKKNNCWEETHTEDGLSCKSLWGFIGVLFVWCLGFFVCGFFLFWVFFFF